MWVKNNDLLQNKISLKNFQNQILVAEICEIVKVFERLAELLVFILGV